MRPGGISSSLGSQAGSRVACPQAILPGLVVAAMGQAHLEAPGQVGKCCASCSPQQGGQNAAVGVPEDEAEQIPQASHGADPCCHAHQVGDWQPLATHPPPCRQTHRQPANPCRPKHGSLRTHCIIWAAQQIHIERPGSWTSCCRSLLPACILTAVRILQCEFDEAD